jgi:hypothetical protein
MADSWHRDVIKACYTVYPVDPSNIIVTMETEASLKNLDINSSINPTRENNILISWSISSIRSDLQRLISAINGVSHVEREGTCRVPATAETSEVELPPEHVRRDTRSYMCLCKSSSNAEEVEQFLRSKVHPDEAKEINQMTRRGKVVGWAGLVLDDAAREEVASHPGISNLRKSLITHPD